MPPKPPPEESTEKTRAARPPAIPKILAISINSSHKNFCRKRQLPKKFLSVRAHARTYYMRGLPCKLAIKSDDAISGSAFYQFLPLLQFVFKCADKAAVCNDFFNHILGAVTHNQLFTGQHNQRYIGIFFHVFDLMRIYPIRAPIQTHNFYHTIFYANSPTVKYLRVFYRNFRDKKPPYYYIGVYFN